MCGIIGYIGNKQAQSILLEGLKRLEYRGYDSSGIVILRRDKKADIVKKKGEVSLLKKELDQKRLVGKIGIAHTRWATHGIPSDKNAHPVWCCRKDFFVAHNGIIENALSLKSLLKQKGHKFLTETDTEVLAHLIEEHFQGDFLEAFKQAIRQISGAYAVVAVSKRDPDKIVFARNSSPLILGLGNKENFIASDASALLSYTQKVVYLNDGEIGMITASGFSVSTLDSKKILKNPTYLDWDISRVRKSGHKYYMLKEICEIPEALENTLRGRIIKQDGLAKLGGLEVVADRLHNIEEAVILGMGTALLSGKIGRLMLEEYAGLSARAENASEFRYLKSLINLKTAAIAVSQSGETIDTLLALREAKRKGALTIGIVNTVGSTIARETDAGIYNHIGPEISVASTKAFASQLVVWALLTVFLGRQRSMSLVMGRRILDELEKLPNLAKQALENKKSIRRLAQAYKNFDHFFYLGRKYHYPVAEEGALKLKEISYIHAEGYSAGEMKHGPIALIDKNFPTIILAPQDSVYNKMLSVAEEIRARKGQIIAVATQGDTKIKNLADKVIYIPKTLEMLTPILAVIPLQLFAYYVADLKGYNVDKPRNLAKSVTVE